MESHLTSHISHLIRSRAAVVAALTAIGFGLQASPRAGSGPQNVEDPGIVRAHVTCAVTGHPLGEAFVHVVSDEPPILTSEVTNGDGAAFFPDLCPQLPGEAGEPATSVTLTVACDGYLPLKRKVSFSHSIRWIECQLVPVGTGFETPLIKADSGGSFLLEGIGHLSVAPNALPQDLHLQLTPIPSWSMSEGLAEGILEYQVWLDATDAQGLPATSTLPLTPNGISLTVDTPFLTPADEPTLDDNWSSHAMGEAFLQDIAIPAAGIPDRHQATMSLARGHNLLTRSYTTSTEAGCVLGPWVTEWHLIGKRRQVEGSVNVVCGFHAEGFESEGGDKIEETTDCSLDVEAAMSVGLEANIAVAKIKGGPSYKISGSIGSRTVTTTTTSAKIAAPQGSPVSGRTPQPSGYGCMTGRKEFGLMFFTYKIVARRYDDCVGAIAYQERELGTVEICSGRQAWYTGMDETHPDPFWDTSCPGCQMPPHNLPDVPTMPYGH